MNKETKWRLELAQTIAPGYMENTKVAAVVVAGSVGRGWADKFSDIELDVFWHEPPTDADRKRPIQRLNGQIIEFWPFEDDEWSEDYMVGQMQVDLSNFLVQTLDQYVTDVVEEADTAVLKQLRLAALQHSIPLHGTSLVIRWQQKAARYPDKLARAMVSENLSFDALGIWYLRHVLAERDDLLMLVDIFCRLQRRILGALLGLNHMYLAHPGFKWLNETAAEMAIAPPDLAARLKQIFHLSPAEAITPMHTLLEETIALAEAQLPGIDLAQGKRAIRRQRLPLAAGAATSGTAAAK